MHESEDNEEGGDTPPTKKIKKSKITIQKFRNEWLADVRFKHWLEKVPNDPVKANCRLCDKIMRAEISVLTAHKLKEKPLFESAKITSFMKSNTNPQGMSNLDVATRNAEIKLIGCLAEHNISMRFLDHLTDAMKSMFPDSKIAQNMNLKRTKGTAIAKNVIGESEKVELTKKLKNTKFSILTDESTDISNTKASCIVVRYYDEEQGQIVSKFWDLVQVFDETGSTVSATGQHLYESLIKSFEEREIPKENIVGFGSDGCNVMMGQHNSVSSRFKHSCPGIIIMKCLCHTFHIIASEACACLPRRIEDLARLIYSFFSASAKRISAFVQFQHFASTPIHAILHPSQTRWLSLTLVVERLLEQWPALQLYFTEKRFVEKLVIAETIYNHLHDPFNKLYLLFLKWVLPKFSRVNQYFQSSVVVITEVHRVIVELYREILSSYMKRDYVYQTDLSKINPSDNSKFLLKNQMYMGVDVMKELQNPIILARPDMVDHFFDRTQEFFITACLQIQKRYDFKDNILGEIHVFKPKTALSHSTRESTPSLVPLLTRLSRLSVGCDLQSIDDEWRKLPSYNFDQDISDKEIDVFWSHLLTLRNDGGEYLFHNLARVVLNILSLPHANADCERTFSKINLIKTKSRNRLIVPTIRGLVLTSQRVKTSGGCPNFTPSLDMQSRMGSSSLYGEKKTATKSRELKTTREDEDADESDSDIIFSEI